MLKKFTLKIWLLGITLLFLQTSFAQKTIQGTVFDDTGATVIGANVWISGTTIGTSTLVDGTFQLEVPEGYFEVDLETSYLGFQKIKLAINLDEWDSNNKKELVLKRENTMLEEVVIVTTRQTKKELHFFCGGNAISKDILRCSNDENCNQKKEKENTGKAIIQIFPNPFVSFIKVQIEIEEKEEAQACLFQLFGIDGKFILSERHMLSMEKEVVRLDVPNLPVGSYVLRIEQEGKMIQSDILIKVSSL